jgi:hypothetical protein
MNDWTDKVAAVLQHRFTQKSICCMVAILGKYPTKHLELIKFGLGVSARGLSVDVRSTLNNMAQQLNSKMAEKIVTPMMHQVDQFIREWTGKSLEMVDPSNYADEDTADIILKCTPIEELFDLIIYAWARLGALLKQLIAKMWSKIKAKSLNCNLTIELMAESERAKRMLKIVEAALSAIEAGNLCANDQDPVTPGEMDNFLADFVGGFPPPVVIPRGDDPYTTFQPVEFTTPNGLRIGGETIPEEDQRFGTTSFRSAECLERYRGLENKIRALSFAEGIEKGLRDAGLEFDG